MLTAKELKGLGFEKVNMKKHLLGQEEICSLCHLVGHIYLLLMGKSTRWMREEMIPSQLPFDCSCQASAGDFFYFFLLEAKWVPQISFLKGMSLSDRALPPVARCEMNLAAHRAQLPHVEFLVLAKFPLKLRYSNKSQS